MTSGGIIWSWFWLLTVSAMWHMARLSAFNTTDTEHLVAENCTLNITDFRSVQKLFEEYSATGNARLVDFRISGIEWSDSSNETVEVFDPNLWSWVAKGSEFLTQMPIDYHILSFGLSRLAMTDLEVNMVDFPYGCVNQLTFEDQRRLVTKELLHLTKRDVDNNDIICRSTYSRRSLMTDRAVGVGKTCCTRGELLDDNPSRNECDLEQAADHEVKGFSEKSTVMMIAVILLPVIIVYCAISWWRDYKQMSFSEEFADYLTNKLQKWAYFSIDQPARSMSNRDDEACAIGAEGASPSSPGTLSGDKDNKEHPSEVQQTGEATESTRLLAKDGSDDRSRAQKPTKGEDTLTLLIAENELVPYEGAVSLINLFDVNMHGVAFGKIKITIIFFLHYVLLGYWLTFYSYEYETLRRLDSTEKILFNLYGNPYSWLWTDNSLFPFYLAILLVFLNAVLFVLVICWWLYEIRFTRSLVVFSDAKKVGEKEVFRIFFYILIIYSYVPAYSTFNTIIHTAGGIIASVGKTLPWLIGALLVVYYIQQTYEELVQTYTQIKREMFKVFKVEENAQRALRVTTADVIRVDFDHNIIEDTTDKITFKIEEFNKPVLFTKYRAGGSDKTDAEDRADQDGDNQSKKRTSTRDNVSFEMEESSQSMAEGIPEEDITDIQDKGNKKENICITHGGIFFKYMVSKSTLRGLCKEIKPIGASIKKEAVKLGFTLLFLVLVVITMTVFQPDAATTEARLVTTSIPPLLIVLTRWLAGKMTTKAEDELGKDIVETNMQELLKGNHPKYKVEVRREKNEVTDKERAGRTTVKGFNPLRGFDIFFGALDHYDKYGMTQLMKAAEKNDIIRVGRLIKAGADPNLHSDDLLGRTAMILASWEGHKEVVAELIKAPGADVNIKDRLGSTALIYASRKGHKEVLAELIKAPGVDVNIKDHRFGRTALMYASREGHKEVVAELIKAPGVDVNIKDHWFGMTALMHASAEGHKEVVAELIKAPGVDVNIKGEDGMTALIWASMFGHQEVVAELIGKGAEVDIQDKRGKTALDWAKEEGRGLGLFQSRYKGNGYAEIVEMLEREMAQ